MPSPEDIVGNNTAALQRGSSSATSDSGPSGRDIVESVTQKGGAAAGKRQEEGLPQETSELDTEPVQGENTSTGQESQESQETQQEPQQQTQESQPQPQQTEEIDNETYAELQELGIEPSVSPSEVPDELVPQYNQLLEDVRSEAQRAIQNELEATEAQLQLQDFAEVLEDNPQQILTTMAVQNPEAFNEAVNEFEKMQTDEEYRNMKLREIQAEAKLREAERKEKVQTEAQLERKAEQFRSRTHRQARRHGVDPELAEEVVAAQIQRTGGDIPLSQVDDIVQRLAPAQSGPQPRSKQPETQQKETQANQSVSGRGAPAGGEDSSQESDDSREPQSLSTRNELFGAVKRAADRASTQTA